MKMGVLAEFVESKGNVEEHGHAGIAVDEILKVLWQTSDLLTWIGTQPILVQEGNNGSVNLLPIDHERSFSNNLTRQQNFIFY